MCILCVHGKWAASLWGLREELSAHTIFGVDASLSFLNILWFSECKQILTHWRIFKLFKNPSHNWWQNFRYTCYQIWCSWRIYIKLSVSRWVRSFTLLKSLEEQMTNANVWTLFPDVCNQICTEEVTTYTRDKPRNSSGFTLDQFRRKLIYTFMNRFFLLPSFLGRSNFKGFSF
jgi:hypothetical protein